ncbi:putative beta-glucosidase 1 [Phaeomoniella chlamydospora]|uniref:beta-glucosidase n=1 Tax=Phaeomoniella chlamydospora TaxID=158046 RepID=A0A0G2FXR0_PHACM|nr:putative beta-glucosidase 1 [Phaeomoniella chlamydospora]
MKSSLIQWSLLLLQSSRSSAYTSWSYTNESEVPYYGLSPPVYPSPVSNGSSSSVWAAAYAKANAVLSALTLEEKVNRTRGFVDTCIGNTGSVPRLGIESLCLSDAPDGIRGQEYVSAFPAGIHIATTWDRSLMYEYGQALAEEYRDKGINIALAPVAGPLGRLARGGRNWEGLSADPYLAGIGMGRITKGIQDIGVIATPKHFLLNEQEFRRNPADGEGEAMSSNADDRTIHELYVFPFMDALREGAAAVMCSYNRVNNSYACQNSKLLNGILKTELGFEGLVISDWNGQHSGVASANAGLDLVMPDGGFWGGNLTEAVNNGSVSVDRLDDMVRRQLAAYFLLGQDKQYPQPSIYSNTQKHTPVNAQGDHGKLIRYEVNWGWNTFNGTLITGGGSGSNSPPYVITPFQAIQERIIKDNGMIRWDFHSENPYPPYVNADACLVFINAYASESFDRTTLNDTFSDNLVNSVAANCSNTIVIIHSAGIRTVDAWIDNENVTAVLFAGLPGQESGHALVDVLWGDVTPSGKLPYTIAKEQIDYGTLLNSTISFDAFPQDNFTEGLYIDYRSFDKRNVEPRFEFGFGLSYTTFRYSKVHVVSTNYSTSSLPDPNISIKQGGHPDLWQILFNVTVDITNEGDVFAHEVPQLYVTIPNAPIRQLRGFDRVAVNPGETNTVTFSLMRRDLSIWDIEAQQWRLQTGDYPIYVGASSRDLRLNATLSI